MIILGIDPGSRKTGFGVISLQSGKLRYLSSGCICLTQKSISSRLESIFLGVTEIVTNFSPDEIAIERVFVHKNPSSALILGHARGVAIAAAAIGGRDIAEYSARSVKQSVVGYGAATKDQVQHMVKILLNISGNPSADAADALAVAICHANSRKYELIKHS